ncbi:MAG: cell division protein FtsZ, partial [Nitratireductor sp.]
LGILTVGVVTKPFQFEGGRRMTTAEEGIAELQKNVDTLIVIPNQNLLRIANDKTTFADAFGMADQVLYSGVACITDLMVKEGLINLDFADVRSVMHEMGKAMMGTGESSGEGRAMQAAEAAISNPLLDEVSMNGAQGLLISITGGRDMTLFEVDEAATRIREEVDQDANIIVGATFDENLDGIFRVSVVATGIDHSGKAVQPAPQIERTQVERPQAISAPSASLLNTDTASSAKSDAHPLTTAQKPTSPIMTDIAKVASTMATPRAPVEANGVRIEPMKAPNGEMADLASDFENTLEEELMPKAEAYVPPAADLPSQGVPQQRMPEVADFPPMVKETVKASEATKPAESGPMNLLQRLKSGLGVSDNSTAPQQRAEPKAEVEAPQVTAEVKTDAAPSVSQDSPITASLSTSASEESPYAPKRGNLDNTGRAVPQPRAIVEDDQLDIPAFLRRQA